jgi:ketosteroid isomerase-like protein
MKRKKIILVLLIVSVCTLTVWAGDDEDAVKQAVKNYYYLYFVKMDKNAYRSILTEDYQFLENGELFDADGDIAAMPDPDSGYERTDTFDFRYVKIEGDIAYTVYFLKAEIKDKENGTINKEWLESTILRRSGDGWLIALLHSTRITKPEN